MHKYEVGKIYDPRRTRWPMGADYSLLKGGHEFRLFLPDVEARDVANIRGRKEFALFEDGPILALLYRFGSMAWSDVGASWHLTRNLHPDDRSLPPELPTPESRATVMILLIESNSGILKEQVFATFSPEFSRAFHEAIERDALAGWPGNAVYNAHMEQVYADYPNSEAMLKKASARCVAGEP